MTPPTEIAGAQAARPAPESDISKLARGAGVNLVGKMGGRAIHLLTQILLARLLGPATFGLYAIGWNFLRMVDIAVPLGLDFGVIRFGAAEWERGESGRPKVVDLSVALSLFSGAAVGLAFFLLAPWLAGAFRKPDLLPVIRWFALAFPLLSGMKAAAAATRITKRMKYAVLAEEVGQPAANLALVVIFYLLGWGLLGAVGAGVVSFGVGLLLAFAFVWRLFSSPQRPSRRAGLDLRALLSFSLSAAAAWMFASLVVLTDRIFVGYYLPEAQVGVYQAVSLSSVAFVIILSAFNTIVSPMVADLHQKGENRRLQSLFQVSTRWSLYLSLPLAVFIWFAPREIMVVLYGEGYAGGTLPLTVLGVAHLVNVAKGPVDHVLVMSGHQRDWLRISAQMLAANLLFNWALVPRFGLLGASLATLLTFVGVAVLGLLRVKRLVGFWPYNHRYLKGVIAAGAAAGALALFSLNPSYSPFVSLALKGSLALGVFSVTLVSLGLDGEDRELLALLQDTAVPPQS